MFFIKAYLTEVEACGGAYIVKAKGTVNPTIRHAYRTDGKELKDWRGLRLKAVKRRLARYGVVDIDVSWPLDDGVLEARLIVSRVPEGKILRYLVTNLPRDAFTAACSAPSAPSSFASCPRDFPSTCSAAS